MDISKDISLFRLKQTKTERRFQASTDLSTEDRLSYNRKLRDACDGFEEIFVHKMLQVMRETTEKSDFLSGGRGEEIFQDMLDENYAKLISKSRTLGLGDMIYEHTKKK